MNDKFTINMNDKYFFDISYEIFTLIQKREGGRNLSPQLQIVTILIHQKLYCTKLHY